MDALSAFVNLGLEKRKKSENHTSEEQPQLQSCCRGHWALRAVGGLTEHNMFNRQGLSSLPVFCLLRHTSLKGTVSIRKKDINFVRLPHGSWQTESYYLENVLNINSYIHGTQKWYSPDLPKKWTKSHWFEQHMEAVNENFEVKEMWKIVEV